jgi:hypothetical protein
MGIRQSLHRCLHPLTRGRRARPPRAGRPRLTLEGLEERLLPFINLDGTGLLLVVAEFPGAAVVVERPPDSFQVHASIDRPPEEGFFPIGAVREIEIGAPQGGAHVTVNVWEHQGQRTVPDGTSIDTAGAPSSIDVRATPPLSTNPDARTTITGQSPGPGDLVRLGNPGNPGSPGVQDIRGPVSVSHPGGFTALKVDDSGDATGRRATLAVDPASGLGTIDSLAPARISYQPSDLRDLCVTGGSGGNTFLVLDTGQSPAPLRTTLNAGNVSPPAPVAGDDTVIVSHTTGHLQVNGGPGRVTLQGESGADQKWALTGHNVGTLVDDPPLGALDVGFSFAGQGDLQGGDHADTFVMTDGATFDGSIDGSGGTNTLDYSPYHGTVVVDLQTGYATGVSGGVYNIHTVYGGTGGPATGPDSVYDILVGNGGNDLHGGAGRRNLLIAGASHSNLDSGNEGDILIGGWTNYDTDIPTLTGIMMTWTSDSDYADRVTAVMSGAHPLTGGPGGTVHSNGGGNDLNGHPDHDSDIKNLYFDAHDLGDTDDLNPGETGVPITMSTPGAR